MLTCKRYTKYTLHYYRFTNGYEIAEATFADAPTVENASLADAPTTENLSPRPFLATRRSASVACTLQTVSRMQTVPSHFVSSTDCTHCRTFFHVLLDCKGCRLFFLLYLTVYHQTIFHRSTSRSCRVPVHSTCGLQTQFSF